ncbi:MAG: hypothetical protein ACK58L_20620 [Planctomycetota bacterium]
MTKLPRVIGFQIHSDQSGSVTCLHDSFLLHRRDEWEERACRREVIFVENSLGVARRPSERWLSGSGIPRGNVEFKGDCHVNTADGL